MSHQDTVVLIQLSRMPFGLTAQELSTMTPLSAETAQRAIGRLVRTGMVRLVPGTLDRWCLDTEASI